MPAKPPPPPPPPPPPANLTSHLALYPSILQRHSAAKGPNNDGQTLAHLDHWARHTLPHQILSRTHAQRGMDKDELTTVVKWKMARGKFRPTLLPLVTSNDDSTVKRITTSAIDVLSSSSGQDGFAPVQSALDTLCQLKGVGAATASAILALLFPDRLAFLSDELVDVVMHEKPKYTLPYYAKVWTRLTQLQAQDRDEDGDGDQRRQQWSLSDYELAAWALAVSRKLDAAPAGKRKGPADEQQVSKRAKEDPAPRPKIEAAPTAAGVGPRRSSRTTASSASKLK